MTPYQRQHFGQWRACPHQPFQFSRQGAIGGGLPEQFTEGEEIGVGW
ncbi:MAG: hypothetical protein ABI619_09110 [Betaproteobacteria bacterium]